MKKSTILISVGFLMSSSAFAAPLTPEQALARAQGELPNKAFSKFGSGSKLVYTSRMENGNNGVYLFNNANGGYAILSADDIACPLLGYSDGGRIDANALSPELKWWLDEYSRQIEWAINNNAKPVSSAVIYDPSWSAISPMVTTRWNQDAPFNDQCPQIRADGPRCYAGCVAVAMAQVMKYHNYPERGEGLVSNTDKGRPSALNLASYPIEWDKMLNVYSRNEYTEAEGAAVAYLMKACGYATNMKYGTSASGTAGMNIGPALRTNFKYDQNCRGEYRLPYSSREWAEKVYNNLKNVGPLIINGQSAFDGGHSFVCDGYDGKGYFHFNWGWGGYSDGYYLLDALNPDAQGIGGASGGFNFSQDAVFGIQPPTGQPKEIVYANLLQWGSLVGSLSDKTLVFSVRDYNPLGFASSMDTPVKLNFGALIEPVDGTSGEPVIVKGKSAVGEVISLSNGSYYQNNLRPSVDLPSLADGKYKIVFVAKDLDYDDSPWQPVIAPYGSPNYVMLTVENDTYTITNIQGAKYKVNSVEILTDIYQNANFMIKASVTNESSLLLSEGLAPALYLGEKQCFLGESVLATINPDETTEMEWVSKFYPLNGLTPPTTATKYTLKLYDPKTETDYGAFGEIELLPAPGAATLSMRGASFPGMETTSIEHAGKNYPTVYLLTNKDNINFNFKYRVTKGYFDGQLILGVEKMEGNVPVPIVDQIYSYMPFLLASNTNQEVDVNFSLPQAVDGELYRLTINYTSSGTLQTLSSIYFVSGSSGIDGIEMDGADSNPEYYNLQGIKLTEPVKGEMLIEKKSGKSRIIKF